MLITRPTVGGSPNRTTPSTAVPTAPTPTQTAYAVPTGSDLRAIPSSAMLANNATAVHKVGQTRVKPSVYLSPIAQPTSNNPATTKVSQAAVAVIALSLPIGAHHSDMRDQQVCDCASECASKRSESYPQADGVIDWRVHFLDAPMAVDAAPFRSSLERSAVDRWI